MAMRGVYREVVPPDLSAAAATKVISSKGKAPW
jgi:hypothetical protein